MNPIDHPLFWLFFSSFVFVFLRAFQQQNVIHKKYQWVLPISYALCAAEYLIITTAVKMGYGFVIVLVGGSGGGLGCVCSMWVHGWLLHRKNPATGHTLVVKETGQPERAIKLD